MKMTNEQYSTYVDTLVPPSKTAMNTLRAFIVGGFICALGEGISRALIHFGVETQNAYVWVAISLIFLAALATGLGFYDKLAQIGKAGTLVPITGFSNAVVSPAMEFKSEGYVTGLSAKLFSIAGPVLVFGTIAAMIYGVIYALFL